MKGKTKRIESGHSSKMTPSCKWPIVYLQLMWHPEKKKNNNKKAETAETF